MKILFTQDALVDAGAERSHLEILARFSEEVEVGFVYFYPKHELKEAYQRAGIRLFFLDIPERYHFVRALYRLVKLIRSEKPDLLISSLWRADMITRMASWLTGVPLIGTLVNDSYSPIAWSDKKGFKHKLVYWLDLLTAGIPIHWIANAQALADSHVKTLGIKKNKISVVYRGRPVVPSDWGAKQSSIGKITSSAVCAELPMKEPKDRLATTRNFISYGRLLERKGFQDAIRAFSQVIQTYTDCTLTIFGEGPYRTELEKLIQDLELNTSVFLPGKISNPMETLMYGFNPRPTETEHCELFTAHCFLFPSWYEGFSGALVEAMMAGIPIIASDIPMNLEAVADQKTALIFQMGNSLDLAEKMKFAIQNPELMTAFGNSARKEAIERFDIEKIAKEYEAVIKGMIHSLKGGKEITPPQPSPEREGEGSRKEK